MPFKLKSLDGSVTPFRDSEYFRFTILSQEAFYKNAVQS